MKLCRNILNIESELVPFKSVEKEADANRLWRLDDWKQCETAG